LRHRIPDQRKSECLKNDAGNQRGDAKLLQPTQRQQVAPVAQRSRRRDRVGGRTISRSESRAGSAQGDGPSSATAALSGDRHRFCGPSYSAVLRHFAGQAVEFSMALWSSCGQLRCAVLERSCDPACSPSCRLLSPPGGLKELPRSFCRGSSARRRWPRMSLGASIRPANPMRIDG
jgi:hypothetical protein